MGTGARRGAGHRRQAAYAAVQVSNKAASWLRWCLGQRQTPVPFPPEAARQQDIRQRIVKPSNAVVIIAQRGFRPRRSGSVRRDQLWLHQRASILGHPPAHLAASASVFNLSTFAVAAISPSRRLRYPDQVTLQHRSFHAFVQTTGWQPLTPVIVADAARTFHRIHKGAFA